ncbi:hypothetical protein [Paenirhodobacter sp.]|uniref:hypothetical protein n=1 Tax=Paenirhodobacter sp. TaxID=1965326 RepID=UPI003B421284
MKFLTALALCLALPAAAQVPDLFPLPDDFYPESVAIAEDGTTYIGSWHQGSVARLRPGETRTEVFIPPGSNGLFNTQGLLIDAARETLWACSGDTGFSTAPRTESALKAFDLTTGAPKASYALPGGGYCNDLALDAGRVFVSDTKRPRILVLDAAEAELRVWAENPAFCDGPMCLNGITIDPGKAVYVSRVAAAQELLRVGLRDGAVTSVPMPRVLKNADAIRFVDGRIVIFENNTFAANDPLNGSISVATLHPDGPATLDTLANGLADPSSGAVHDGRIYFIEFEIHGAVPPCAGRRPRRTRRALHRQLDHPACATIVPGAQS